MMTPAPRSTNRNGGHWAENWLRGVAAAIVVAALSGATTWGAWATLCLIEIRERIVRVEVQVTNHIGQPGGQQLAASKSQPVN